MSVEFVPGLAGVPAAKSAISFVDGERGRLSYRGYAITDLAREGSFEETAYLLLEGRLPTRAELAAYSAELAARRPLDPALLELLRAFPRSGHPMNALQAAVAALGMLHDGRKVGDPYVRRETVLRLTAQMGTITATLARLRRGEEPVAPPSDGSHAAAFLTMLNDRAPTEVEERVLDAALVLHADHTMNASTFTARVVASTLADGYAVMAGALGSLSGPLHGGANEAVLHLLDRIGSLDEVPAEVGAMIDRKEKIMGVGHRVYKVKDPRAHVLQSLAEGLFAEGEPSRYYPMARALEQVVEERLGAKGIHPNVDFYSGIVYDRLGIDRALFTPIFAVSRIAGWSAHWVEQLEDNRIFRPRQVYTGEGDRDYVPLEAR